MHSMALRSTFTISAYINIEDTELTRLQIIYKLQVAACTHNIGHTYANDWTE